MTFNNNKKYHYLPKHPIKIIVLFLIIAILGCAVNYYLQYNYFYPLNYYDEVYAESNKYDIDPLLIMAVIKAESNFDPKAISHKDAVGLMQITPATAEWAAKELKLSDYNTEKLSRPETNITIGIWYIDYLLDYYEDNLQLALSAYNAGTGTVDRWLENNQITENGSVLTLPYKETSRYLININAYYDRYKQLY